MQKHIFRKYDIRGIVGQDILLEEVYALTHAIVGFYLSKNPNIKRIAVGRDHRFHSQDVYNRVAQAIIDRGLQVYFLGECATPVFVFGLHRLPVQAGIMITGSHHGAEYNGFKLYLDKQSVWGDDIDQIYQHYENQDIVIHQTPGKIVPCPIVDQYVDTIWQQFSHLSQYDFSMHIDCAGGMTGPILKKIIAKMNWKKVKLLLSDLDPSFKYHEPDPAQIKNMEVLTKSVAQDPVCFGIGFDGDAGRMICLEHNGSLVLGDRLLAIFAQDLLKCHPGATIVYDVKSSMLIKEVVDNKQGVSVVSACGAPLLKEQMKNVGALLGGEMTGHYFFKDRHPGYDDGIYAMFRLLDILVRSRKSLYELLQDLPQLCSSYEIRIPCTQQQKDLLVKDVMNTITLSSKWKVSQVDGIRAECNQGWALLRACNTQSMLSFRCEAKNIQDLSEVKKEFKAMLSHHFSADELQKYF